MNRREFTLGGLALFVSACTETPVPTPPQTQSEITIDSNKPFATFPHGIIANFTEIPIRVFPKNLDLVCKNPAYNINVPNNSVGFFVIIDSSSEENSPVLRAYLNSLTPYLRESFTKDQQKTPDVEFRKAVSLPRIYRENFAQVPIIPRNLPILAHNIGITLNFAWASFMHTEAKKRSKIPYAGETLSTDSQRYIAYTKLFQIPELTFEIAQSLKGN